MKMPRATHFYTCLLIMVFFSGTHLAHGLCVSSPSANLRAGASSKSKVTWRVGQYMPLREKSKKGGWYQVEDLEGQTHWVHRSVVTSDIDCLVVKAANANLRTGPGTEFSEAEFAVADRYMPYQKLERDGAWLKIRDDYGGVYWVHEKLIWEPLNYSNIEF